MWNSIPIKKYKRKKKSNSRKIKRISLRSFAKNLNKNLPKSEVWFQDLYAIHKDPNDLYNKPLHIRIPDVMNKIYKYIIEIDGSIHDTPKQQYKDYIKDSFYKRLGFKVFRIKAYDINSFNATISSIKELRNNILIK